MRSGTMKERLIIFDTTMRDGEQSPGASMTKEEKLRIARQLERMRVDVIEAGFPASSNGDFEAVQAGLGAVKEMPGGRPWWGPQCGRPPGGGGAEKGENPGASPLSKPRDHPLKP